jgi:hypothetical protein
VTTIVRTFLLLSVAVALAGCGGGDDGSTAERLDPALAQRLASESDAVADALEAGDGCAAVARVQELRRSLASAQVPAVVRRQAERSLDRADSGVVCTPPPPPPPPVVSAADQDEQHDKHEKRKKHKNKHGKHGKGEEGDE